MSVKDRLTAAYDGPLTRIRQRQAALIDKGAAAARGL